MEPTISINIITYGIPDFVDKVLDSLIKSGVPEGVPIRLFEDKFLDYKVANEVSQQYKDICAKYGVEYHRTSVWGCCQGAAQFASITSKEDWLILLGDDALVKKGAATAWIDRIRSTYDKSSAGLVNVSWWDSLELIKKGIIKEKKEILEEGFLDKVPDNPTWERRPEVLYVNVHGSGFMMRRKMWEEVGGFSQNTWVWDEDISFRCWMFSRYNIFTSPGPSIIHYCGKATSSIGKSNPAALLNPRTVAVRETFGNGCAWDRSWGYNKDITCPLVYIALKEASRSGNTIDKCALRDKPLSEKITDWEAASKKYNELGPNWFLNNDIATLGV